MVDAENNLEQLHHSGRLMMMTRVPFASTLKGKQEIKEVARSAGQKAWKAGRHPWKTTKNVAKELELRRQIYQAQCPARLEARYKSEAIRENEAIRRQQRALQVQQKADYSLSFIPCEKACIPVTSAVQTLSAL